tara:strand:+ start:56364 stop:56480 length:117 start_codon:yes stop_codon:yes gene_type:complete
LSDNCCNIRIQLKISIFDKKASNPAKVEAIKKVLKVNI